MLQVLNSNMMLSSPQLAMKGGEGMRWGREDLEEEGEEREGAGEEEVEGVVEAGVVGAGPKVTAMGVVLVWEVVVGEGEP